MIHNRSVKTIDGPEFIDVKPYNPLVSQCNIKVLYLGKNRNGSYVDRNTAVKMANSLPTSPIVGAWRKDVEDFGDHGKVVTIEDGEIKFACKTVPFGFVAPDAKVWFQKFNDIDAFGNETEREYMMTTGYLWTGQFPEAQKAIDEGQPQSMELDEKTLKGRWANDTETGMEFFIINDAVFSKLCILGDDVEPCFEGASVTGVESNFTENAEFAHSLYTMMNQLKDIVSKSEGGMNVSKPKTLEEPVQEEVAIDYVASNSESDKKDDKAEPAKADEDVEKTDEETPSEEEQEKAADDKKDKDEPKTDHALTDEPVEEPSEPAQPGADFAAVEEEPKSEASDEDPDASHEFALEQENEALKAELDELRQFKLSVENKEKDALIAKYHMLSDEDKAEIVAHKEEYSLEQIEEKLALVYVRKNVDFSTVDGHHEEEVDTDSILSFSLDNTENAEVVSDIQAAFRSLEK